MDYSRRELFEDTAKWLSVGALSQLFPNISFGFPATFRGRDSNNHFFVLVRTFGGMDVTLGLDPQIRASGVDEKDLFLEYRPEDILQAAGLKLGPAAAPLVAHASDCLVINGVQMRRDAGHFALNLYIISGRGDGKAAAVPVELALSKGSGPFGVLTNLGSYLAGKAATLSATGDFLNGDAEEDILDLLEQKLAMGQGGTPFGDATTALVEARPIVKKLSAILQDFKKESGTLKDAHVLAAGLASGACWEAQLDLSANADLDTHSNHEAKHLGVQKKVWTGVAELFSIFKKVPFEGKTLFDATTFMVASEFSRTPALNAAKGKDHNPFTNSVLLAGKGIQKGTTVGASLLIPRGKTKTGEPEHIAHPYNFKEKKLADKKEGASFFFPENVIQTVGEIFGNPKGFSPVPNGTLSIPFVVS